MKRNALSLPLLLATVLALILSSTACSSDEGTGATQTPGANNQPANNDPGNNEPGNNEPGNNEPDDDVGPLPDSGEPDVLPGLGECDPNGPQCNNCIDDDGDGLIDGFDPHCISPFDDNESGFATGIPGDNMSSNGFQDCFFDGNSGSGDDGCRIPDGCILGTQTEGCEVSEQCVQSCKPRTRQGCDCFGCCTICTGDECHTAVVHPALAPDCTLDALGDPTKCPVCTLNEQCSNPCDNDDCELCPGQLPTDLPEHCGNEASCPDHMAPCTTTADCGYAEYCSVGCCVPVYQ